MYSFGLFTLYCVWVFILFSCMDGLIELVTFSYEFGFISLCLFFMVVKGFVI